MRTRTIAGFVLLTAASVVKADGGDLSASRVFEVAAPSIVVVEAHNKDGAIVARGSGVVIAKGIVVSNCHVFTKADTAVVRYSETNYPAALQHGDMAHDLCSFTVNGLPAPPVRMSSTQSLKVGESAFAIGAPEGLELTLSGGLISSLRKLPDGVVIQMTTPISPGSSGGGLFDQQARLIGITSYYMGEGQQLNFALPVEWINELPQRGRLKATADQTPYEPPSQTAPPDALSEGGRALLSGDYASALKILEPLANHGNAMAQSALGAMYEGGLGVSRDYSHAVQWYRKAADRGDAFAENALGEKYYLGEGVSENKIEAAIWYRKAANQGNLDAQTSLGAMYLHGEGVAQDYSLALTWTFKAASQGNALAQYNIGTMFAHGTGVPQSDAVAAKWFQKAAAQGLARAQDDLGKLYIAGHGVPQDYGQALTLVYAAAEQGDIDAQYTMGTMIYNGQGMKKDYAQALAWFLKSATQGKAEAQLALARMYYSGQGTTQNKHQSFLWMSKAAEQGLTDAETVVGWAYDKGDGVPQDYEQAIVWYRRAVAKEDFAALNNLGTIYQQGRGVNRDAIAAYALYNLATTSDPTSNNLASQNRDDIAAKMTSAQIDAGQKLTRKMLNVGILQALDAHLKIGSP